MNNIPQTIYRILTSIAHGLGFSFIASFISPELLLFGTYFSTLVYSFFNPAIASSNFVDALHWGLWMEFLLTHASVGISVARLFTSKRSFEIIAIIVASLFYGIFIFGLVLAKDAYWLGLLFFYLTFQRMKSAYQEDTDSVGKEIAISFGRNMLLIFTAGISAFLLSISGPRLPLVWGSFYFAFLYIIIRFWHKRLSQSQMAKAFAEL